MCCVKNLVCFVVLGNGLDITIVKPVDDGRHGISVKSWEMIGLRVSCSAGILVE